MSSFEDCCIEDLNPSDFSGELDVTDELETDIELDEDLEEEAIL